jgi:hypothetical protein
MRLARILLIAVLLPNVAALTALARAQDLSGTWTGETVVPDSTDKDLVTLVLKKDAASYTGTLTDSMGMANAAILEKVAVAKDALTFEFVITTGSGEAVRIRVALKISGEKLVGSWESDDGATGNLEMSRKK